MESLSECLTWVVAMAASPIGWLSKAMRSPEYPSTTRIAEAKRAFPELDLRVGSAHDPLHEAFGTFSAVVSLEVVEHVYSPRDYAWCVFSVARAWRMGIHLDTVPWLSQESRSGTCWKNGFPLHRSLGSWAHQLLVARDVDDVAW